MSRGDWQLRLVTCWAILWFVVISPAHQRGAIQLPMTAWQKAQLQQANQPVKSCCSLPGVLVDGPVDAQPGHPKPAPNPKRCAVCHINIALTQSPILTFYVPDLGLLDASVPTLLDDLLAQIERPSRGDARAPPHFPGI